MFSEEPIGDGHSSSVYRVTFNQGSFKGYQEAAAKKLLKVSKTEVTILKQLQHKNIVSFIAEIDEGHNYFIVTEFARHGSLYDYLKKSKEQLPSHLIDKWVLQLASALQYLHGKGVLHRDVKSSNCLICDENILKLCDFGISRETEESVTTTSEKGTHRWMAPEVIIERKHSKPSDIYAMSMVFLEICTRKVPFHEIESSVAVAHHVGQLNKKPNVPEDCPTYLKGLFPKCWESDRNERPLIEEVVQIIQEGRYFDILYELGMGT